MKKLTAEQKQYIDSWEMMGRQLSQDTASYDAVGGITNGGDKACANCNWFVEPSGCILVAGPVSPTGVSNLWMAEQEYVQDPIPVTIVTDTTDVGEAAASEEAGSVLDPIVAVVSGIVGKVKNAFKSNEQPGVLWQLKEMPDGRLRFFCTPTNCFEDRENDIFTTDSHEHFVKWADEKEFYPELWIWHTPGTKFGQVDWIDVSDGVLVASGLIDEGKEDLAKSFKSTDGMSHGYLYADKKDGVIDRYWSYEFSVLPRAYAANTATAFYLPEGLEMAFTEEKKSFLRQKGISDADITTFEQGSENLAKSMKALGINWKSDEEAEQAQQEVTDSQALAQVITQQQQIITALGAMAGQVVETKELAVKASKSLDEAVSANMASVVSQLPQGTKASERSDNVVSTEVVKTNNDWFESIMGQVMKAAS